MRMGTTNLEKLKKYQKIGENDYTVFLNILYFIEINKRSKD